MGDEKYRTTTINGKRVSWDPTQLRKIKEHPCFSEAACHVFGRMHLPVAPRCNIHCNYCVRKFDCINESRPGVTSKILSAEEAIERVKRVLRKHHYIKVIAIAGPGDPLFNHETFRTLRIIRKEFPHIMMCLSTNGLLLPERMNDLTELGVYNLTVTINAVDPKIGKQICSFVNYHRKVIYGEEAARVLLENQLNGIRMAVERRIVVKVNTVLIPTINEDHIIEVARKASELGVYMQNIIPLIPLGKLAHIKPPSLMEKRKVQDTCNPIIKQMMHCRQCRADSTGKLGRDLKTCLK